MQFWADFDIWWCDISTPFTNKGQIWCDRADQCEISSQSVYSVALWQRKPPNFVVFGLWHFVVVPVGDTMRKVNMDAQLQTFCYPTVSKSFLYSNVFMAKSGALTFKSVMDRQTDKRKKLNVFGRLSGG